MQRSNPFARPIQMMAAIAAAMAANPIPGAAQIAALNAIPAYEARDGKTKLAGLFSGGWPLNAEIAVTSRKGSGIAEAVTLALNTQIKNGNYAKALSRWNLDSEAIAVSRTNPPGLPKN